MNLTKAFAIEQDEKDSLKAFRQQYLFPKAGNRDKALYFCGHSLGLQHKDTQKYLQEELQNWATNGVEGHFKTDRPWLHYHNFLTQSLASLTGAKTSEVVAMNQLTSNLHFMMISFYQPTAQKYKIIIEDGAFPSDQYAAASQAKLHGFEDAIIRIKANEGEHTISTETICETIENHAAETALVLLGGVNYLTGQFYDHKTIAQKSHDLGIDYGIDLAHAMGNVALKLHDWDIDFAVWCSYKYLNGGPGTVGGAFVHEKHHNTQGNRLDGWWGNTVDNRFLMADKIDPFTDVQAWQVSNAPIMGMASLLAPLKSFDEATISELRKKSVSLTAYLEYLLTQKLGESIEIITPSLPEERGAMLSVLFKHAEKSLVEKLHAKGVIVDWREYKGSGLIRIAPIPLYNSFLDVFELVEAIEELV